MPDYKITYEDGTTGIIVANEETARTVAGNGSYELVPVPQDSAEEKAEIDRLLARIWRDNELKNTDKYVSVTDHPDHAKIMDLRVRLRNWPSTDDFPDTKPTIGS